MSIAQHHHSSEADVPEGLSQELRMLVHEERDETMMSMPTERVMRALGASRSWKKENVLSLELVSWFRPVVLAGSFVILMLIAYNVKLSSTNDYDQSPTEMLLGLPPVTVASAYELSIEEH